MKLSKLPLDVKVQTCLQCPPKHNVFILLQKLEQLQRLVRLQPSYRLDIALFDLKFYFGELEIVCLCTVMW